MTLPSPSLDLSGERFSALYRLLAAGEAEARAKAYDICLEQTVEIPDDVVPAGDIREQIVGRVERLEPLEAGHWEAEISYAIETTSFELPQLLGIAFGNISMKPGIRLERLELPERLLRAFRGPRFGREGLRAWVGVEDRPLLCTALKPLGLRVQDLVELAYRFALGGIDLIKDDQGLVNQPFAPYRERVARCAQAVARANAESGQKCRYLPNVTAPAGDILERALFAREAGAGGLLISPGLTGFDAVRQLAEDDRIGLPIMAHPSMLGGWVVHAESGMAPFVVFGQLMRLAGVDASVFTNYGGRFPFSAEWCRNLADGTEAPMGHLKPIFPVPAGGMSLERVPEMRRVYGREAIFLIGGALHQRGPDLVENSRYFRELAEEI